MSAKELMMQVQSMTDCQAGKVLKYVFVKMSNEHKFDMTFFNEAITALSKKTTKRSGATPTTPLEMEFERFRKSYKGTKRSFATEYGNLINKHDDWMSAVPCMMHAWEKEQQWHDYLKKNGMFCPEYKNLKTWIDQRCWEADLNIDQMQDVKRTTIRTSANANNAASAILSLAKENN